MKLLGLDSSFEKPPQGAGAGGCTSAATRTTAPRMNIWLHRQVMTKLGAENGGQVPTELKD